MKKYDYVALKAAQVTLRNAAERRDNNWWRMFARYAEIAKRKLWYIEIGLFFCLILALSGCNTIEGARMDIHQWTDTPAHHK
jgi:hypothetical protein